MKVTKNILAIGLSALVFSGCSAPLVQYSNDTKVLSLKINDKTRKNLKLNNVRYESRGGQCIQNHFAIADKHIPKYGHIFAEHIEISSNCEWNGLAEGYWVSHIKKYFKVKEVKRISNKKIGQYEFSTFLLDNSYEIKMIEIWGSSENTFIFDVDGIFSEELESDLNSK
jgi:hypothetical protein